MWLKHPLCLSRTGQLVSLYNQCNLMSAGNDHQLLPRAGLRSLSLLVAAARDLPIQAPTAIRTVEHPWQQVAPVPRAEPPPPGEIPP